MFTRLTNALGLNPVKVETLLDAPQVMVGSVLSGVVHVTGTTADKTLNHITLHLKTIAEKDTDNGDVRQNHTLGSVRLCSRQVLRANDRLSLPFHLTLSQETPITQVSCRLNQVKLWLETEVDVASTIDSQDKDPVYTTPTPVMARFLEAMSMAGFRLQKTDVELGYLNTRYGRSSFGCYQELEYSAPSFGLNSVEVSFLPVGEVVYVVLEIDRMFRSDSYQVFGLNDTMSIESMVGQIRQVTGV